MRCRRSAVGTAKIWCEPVVSPVQLPTAEQVQSLLCKQYHECSDLRGLRMLSRGRNAIFEMHVGAESYVVKSGRKGDALARLTRHAALAHGLTALGAAAEQLSHTSAGELVGRGDDGLVVAVFRKIRGVACDFTSAGYGRLGLALALWHRAAARAKVDANVLSSLSPAEILALAEKVLLHTSPPGLPGCPAFAMSSPGEQRLTSCVRFLRGRLPREEEHEDWVGHGDPHPLNLLRAVCADGRQQSTLIDLEDAYRGSRLHDLGTIVWSTLRCEPTRPLWMAALEAYDRELGLANEELDQVGYFVALRHLWWLALHARHWGQYAMHYREPRFVDVGVELLEVICQDACGANLT